MALETSSDAYEMLYENSGPEERDKYYEGYIEMKGRFMGWTRYWCVLKKKNLHFFKDVNTQIKDHYEGYFTLDGVTNIEVKPKNNELHIIKSNKDKKIILRMLNVQLIETWVKCFRKAMKGEPPENQSHILPGSGAVSPIKRKQSLQLPQSSPRYLPAQIRKHSIDSQQSQPLGQVENIFTAHARQVAESAAKTDAKIRIQNQLLAEDSWYQPTLRREDAEKLLKNLENGIFIVRDHIDRQTSKKMGYVISFKYREGQWRHHRITNEPDGKLSLHLEGDEKKVLNSLPNILVFFISSQKTITLRPYSPQIQPSGYELIGPAQTNGTQERRKEFGKARSLSLKDYSNTHPHRPKARSKSLYNPQKTTALNPGVGRADSFTKRALPTLPANDSQCDTAGYEEMVPAQRPLPPPPDEGVYLEPSDQNRSVFVTKRNPSSGNSPCDSYVNVPAPKKLDRITSGIELRSSPPLSPDNQSSYVDMSPPSCDRSYENVQPNGVVEEQAPKLPPRRVKSMKQDRTYINVPGANQPPRPPLRKAFTLER